MKTLALIAILALHLTGLWGHTSAGARDRLIATAAPNAALSAPTAAPANPAATTTPDLTADPATPAALPVRAGAEPLDPTATSAIAVDADTATVLFAKDPGARRPIASITKLVTCLVALSHHTPETPLTILPLPAYGPDDERIGLTPGETYTVGDLVRAALINSGNDAADALALADAGSLPKFAAAMNAKMTEWGITGARFSNPTGLSDTDNYATAGALARIARLALVHPFIRDAVTQSSGTITSTTGRTIHLTATNKLLATGQFYGIKTGYTPTAGECFVGLARIQGHDVITVVLDATDRFGVTQTLANWISRNYQWL